MWLLGGVGVAAAVVGAIYLATGAGSEKNSPFIPDTIEKGLDKVVDALNQQLGKGWIKVAEAALLTAIPPALRHFVAFVRAAEFAGLQNEWTGSQKRQHAAHLYRQHASA